MDLTTLEVLEGIEETASIAEGQGAPIAAQEGAQTVELQDGTALDHLATFDAGQRNPEIIFAGEGRNLTQKPPMTAQYARKLAETARIYRRIIEGRYSLEQVSEAMMSSEFSALLGDTMDRVLLAKYATYQPSYRQFLRGRTVRDFRAVESIRRNTGSRLTATAEGETYREEGLSEASYSYSVAKYGKVYSLTWEMIVNDDLDAFTTLPDDMADDAIQTEMYLASSLYVNNTTLFATDHSHNSSTYSNKGTAALAMSALETAYEAMLKYPGDSDKPLNNMPVFLVVPPALSLEAQKLLGTLQVAWAGGDSQTGIAAVAYPTFNAMAGRLQIIVDPYIPVIDTTNGHTSWYLFSNPRQGFGAEYAFLRGYEQPQVFRRLANAQRLGGGQADVSFDDDTTGFKVRHVFGGSHANAAGGWRYCYWSNGTA